MKKYEFIPEEAFGMATSMYTIALEGWRRGLQLKFYNRFSNEQKRIGYTLSDGINTHRFQLSIGDKTPRKTTRLTRDKQWTKDRLIEKNVPTPEGFHFTKVDTIETMVNDSLRLKWPLVVKPVNSSLGVGVTTDINDKKTLINAIKNVTETLGYDDLIVERFINGEDARLVVVGDQVVNAHKRVPISIVGDGKSTVEELIKNVNKKRSNHPHLYKYKIKISDDIKSHLKSLGYSSRAILPNKKKLYLSSSSLLSEGAEVVSLTNSISNKAKLVAVNAVKAMPGMVFAGVDVMIDNNSGDAFVLEINSRPNLAGSLYPFHGTGDDVPKAIIDLYFPQTKNTNIYTKVDINKVYFDFKEITESLDSGLVEEVHVKSIPEALESKLIILTGKLGGKSLDNIISNTAKGLKLNGQFINKSNEKMSLTLFGTSSQIERFIQKVRNRKFKNTSIDSIKIKEWDDILILGFKKRI